MPYSVEREKQTFAQAYLDALVVRHRISLIMQLPSIDPSESPAGPFKGIIALCTKFVESRLTLPLSDTLQMLIHQMDLALGQLNPNIWQAILCSIIV